MKKIILAAVGALVLLGAGGGTVAYLHMKHHAGPPKPPPPKPILFAELDNLVVSVPVDSSGQSGQAYVQFSIEFASTDPKALVGFNGLKPIIKAKTINLLMTQTAKQLMDPSTHAALAKNCTAIANQVLDKSAAFTPPNPFTAAYITNLVEQD
ncbi:flagellar basal body-associated protein FliL [Acidocella sp.]|uniref:flagellar basal body-associated FliL family protein n=1 Tax=Acidocella sp. TaxID=50710 RepID=UPI00261B8353|nr:flagellar basal body-associated FliL family protein [Acidocella sp.]